MRSPNRFETLEYTRNQPDSNSSYFVAAAICYDNAGGAYHAGLLTNTEKGLSFIHYDYLSGGSEISIDDSIQYYHDIGSIIFFNKITNIVSENEANLFLARCKLIQKRSKPQYGYFFPEDAYFLHDGTYLGRPTTTIFCTCVGFCLLIINGWIKDIERIDNFNRYIDMKDWPVLDPNANKSKFEKTYNTLFNALPEEDQHSIYLLRKDIKRITPSEYLAASFLNKNQRRYEHIRPCLEDLDEEMTRLWSVLF